MLFTAIGLHEPYGMILDNEMHGDDKRFGIDT
jgi:hypothetical protein